MPRGRGGGRWPDCSETVTQALHCPVRFHSSPQVSSSLVARRAAGLCWAALLMRLISLATGQSVHLMKASKGHLALQLNPVSGSAVTSAKGPQILALKFVACDQYQLNVLADHSGAQGLWPSVVENPWKTKESNSRRFEAWFCFESPGFAKHHFQKRHMRWYQVRVYRQLCAKGLLSGAAGFHSKPASNGRSMSCVSPPFLPEQGLSLMQGV